jgi:hypothetical protein
MKHIPPDRVIQAADRIRTYRALRWLGLGLGVVGAGLASLLNASWVALLGLALMALFMATGTGLLGTVRCPRCEQPMVMPLGRLFDRGRRYYNRCAHCQFQLRKG